MVISPVLSDQVTDKPPQSSRFEFMNDTSIVCVPLCYIVFFKSFVETCICLLTVAPDIQVVRITYTGYIGYNVTMLCKIVNMGMPPAIFYWKKNGTHVPSDLVVNNNTHTALILTNVTKSDEAEYKCGVDGVLTLKQTQFIFMWKVSGSIYKAGCIVIWYIHHVCSNCKFRINYVNKVHCLISCSSSKDFNTWTKNCTCWKTMFLAKRKSSSFSYNNSTWKDNTRIPA